MHLPAEPETARHLHVPGHQAHAHGRGGPDRHVRFRSMSRASSGSSSPRVPTSASDLGKLGIPVDCRTLSPRAPERRQAEEDSGYFANVTYHRLSIHQLCQQLGVAPLKGLSEADVDLRLARDGDNVLPVPKSNYGKTLLLYTFGGFCSVLWVGVVVFFICWRPLSYPPSPTYLALSVLILIVITLQAGFSSFQDWSTSRTMRSILDLIPSETLAMRSGHLQFVPSMDLVAGDIVHLSTGSKVPADIRLVNHSADMRLDRAAITGEAEEIEASIDCTSPNYLESRNVALMGTIVVNGSGMGVVVLTGHRSGMGRIAHAMSSVKERPTLIQKEIWRFVRIIVVLTIGLALLLATSWVGWLRLYHQDFMSLVAMLSNMMGSVVAFIPEGMPIAVSLTLMLIARRMKAINVLPKTLGTVETLGCVTVICSDKTGTLTENRMSVTSVAFLDQLSLRSQVYDSLASEKPRQSYLNLFHASVLCNDGLFDPRHFHLPVSERRVLGNATDAALLRFAAPIEGAETLKASSERAFQIPFNSKHKWMLTAYPEPSPGISTGQYRVYVKGAPEVLLPACSKYWSGKTDSIQPFDDAARASFKDIQDRLSRNSERVIVLCEKLVNAASPPSTSTLGDEIQQGSTQDLIVIAILGILDPPRSEAVKTVAECRRSGSRFFMVTGDYGLTGAAIARSIGIFAQDRKPDGIEELRTNSAYSADDLRAERLSGEGRCLLIEGPQISTLTVHEWDLVCEYDEVVFARTTPEQKLRIVKELQSHENIVAVTGDGVNDAPAMRAADIGVAVATGSDVAIEAADIVLLDKFDSIVEGIRLGRLVFQNLQKVIAYLLPAGSCSEIWPVVANAFFGVPLPLSSFLMITICVFTDLFLSLSLTMEKQEFDLLSIKPRNVKQDHLITAKIYFQAYFFSGLMETCIAHAMFFLYMWKYAGISMGELLFLFEGYSDGFHGYTDDQLTKFNDTGQCVYFVTIVIVQWGNIFSVRNRRLSLLQANPVTRPRRNLWLIAGMFTSLSIAIFVTETSGIQYLFNTTSVPIEFWFIPIPLSFGLLCMDEIRKLVARVYPDGPIAKIAW